MPLTRLAVDDSSHNRDGLVLHAYDGTIRITAFISRRVLDAWVHTRKSEPRPPSLFRQQYNALGKLNLPAMERIVRTKYDRGAAFNRQHPFVDVLLDDIVESGEMLDMNSAAVPPS